ncbi:hypothetical protein [Anaerolentibacter hominis]
MNNEERKKVKVAAKPHKGNEEGRVKNVKNRNVLSKLQLSESRK